MAAAVFIANGAINAAENHFASRKPVCVTVLDSRGSILVQKRMDGCVDGAYNKFSIAKAKTCIYLNTSSRSMREKYMNSSDPAKFTQAATMVSVMNGDLIPVAGGILVQDMDGITVGSVGVSGAAADEDEYMALQGVRALEEEKGTPGQFFKTIPGKHCCTTIAT